MNFHANIASESKKWIEKGIIETDQARKICSEYEADFNNPKAKTRAYNTLIVLGYLFIAISLILLIGENWAQIPRMLITSVLIAATAGVNIFAIFKHKREPNKADALFFLGGLIYGASIILIAQIYHLGEHMPDGIFWWAIGIIPFTLLSRNNHLMILPLSLSLFWFYMEAFEFGNYKFGHWIFILLGVYGLVQWRKNNVFFILSVIVILASLGVTFSFYSNDLAFGEKWLVSLAFLLLLYSFSFFLQDLQEDKFKAYGKILKVLTLLTASINLLLLTYTGAWKTYAFITFDIRFSQLSFYISGVITLISVFILSYYKQYLLAAGWLGLFLLNAFMQMPIEQRVEPIYMEAIYNPVFVIFSISLIIIGVEKSLSYYFFFGVINILLFAWMRYIDLVGNDYIDTSILFIVLAAILLGSAKYWRKVNAK